VQYERIETTINRCHDLSRVAERMIDLAKEGDEETINSWITVSLFCCLVITAK